MVTLTEQQIELLKCIVDKNAYETIGDMEWHVERGVAFSPTISCTDLKEFLNFLQENGIR